MTNQAPIAELIRVRVIGKRHEEFACLLGYEPPEGVEVISREPLYLGQDENPAGH